MRRRHALIGIAATAGTAAALTSGVAFCQPFSDNRNRRLVLDYIPSSLHEGIRRGSARTDLALFFDVAARAATDADCALHVPAGTYPMRTWSPPANLLLTTDGRETVFEQLPTNGVSQRFLRIVANNVRLWPGGSATITGNIEANATSFNSGIQVYADNGVTIDSFVVGDVYGADLGGDVLETGSHMSGWLGRCTIGNVFGYNIYRNIVSITAGRFGTIEGVYQTGGVGLMGLDFEPDPSSGSPMELWTFGKVACHRLSIVGDPAVPIGTIVGDELQLDYTRRLSQPPFNYAGVDAVRSPQLFEVGLRYRNAEKVHIKRAVINNFPRGAIVDIGEGDRDGFTKLMRIDFLELNNNGARSSYEIAQQKTDLLSVGFLRSVQKPNVKVATLIGGSTTQSVAEFGRAEITGKRILEHTGQVRFGDSRVH